METDAPITACRNGREPNSEQRLAPPSEEPAILTHDQDLGLDYTASDDAGGGLVAVVDAGSDHQHDTGMSMLQGQAVVV